MTVSRYASLGVAVAVLMMTGSLSAADDVALRLRATGMASNAIDVPLTIELFRWSTDAERQPLIAALAAPPAAPAPNAAPAAGRGGRAQGAGRGGRGGRGTAPPPSPMARLTAAVKGAPTVGFIWGGITGYSIKYAWRAPATDRTERVVLLIDRRLETPLLPPASSAVADAEFTLLEMQIDAKGTGEARTSLNAAVVVDTTAQTLALDGKAGTPPALRITR
ncbi:MAG TPA: hypothetical protein VFV95_04155 [Vicinamibacterales bacterium]|nr:hypothetical protein [Vicinamibacterales bacterium]